MNTDFSNMLDAMRKIDAMHKMPDGGSQYTMEVALGPSASAKNQARMRVQKVKPTKPMSLGQFMKSCQGK